MRLCSRLLPAVLTAALTATLPVLAAPASAAAPPAAGYHALAIRHVTTVKVAAHKTRVVGVGGHAGVPARGVAAVMVGLSSSAPKRTGGITAWADGTSRPANALLALTAGVPSSASGLVRVSASGRIRLFNSSAATISVALDVSGYVASTSATGSGALHVVAPSRVLTAAKLSAKHTKTVTVAGHAGVPRSGASAVAVTVVVSGATASGPLYVYPAGSTRPTDPVARASSGRSSTAFAMVALGSGGRLVVSDTASRGSLRVTLVVAGYVTSAVVSGAGHYAPVGPSRLVHATIKAHRTLGVTVGGRAAIPQRGVAAAALTTTVLGAPATGRVVAYAAGAKRPSAAGVAFARGATVAGSALVPLSSTGKVTLYNSSSRTVSVVVDVAGYVRSSTAAAPKAGVGRYVRDIDGSVNDASVMRADGVQDATAGASFVLLHIGAQSTDKTGVKLSVVNTPLTYAALVTAINAYVDGFVSVAPNSTATIAIATNNDGDFTTYTASQKGIDWATKVVNPVQAHAAADRVVVAAANDIEPDGVSTEKQAEQWESAYLGATTAKLYFVGSADGCPTSFASTANCNHGWTQAQLYKLSHGINTSRVFALPQIYTTGQATQWANIAATGHSAAGIAGALTERAACPSAAPGCPTGSLRPADGWVALRTALSTRFATVPTLTSVDLRIDG
jgi:hypothetical protein